MDEILLVLLRHGAHKGPVRITTSAIGAEAGMSQQNASRKLMLLEKDGYLQRSKDGIRLVKKGQDDLAAAYASLRRVFEGERLEIEGTIVKGLGEGKYYLSLDGYRKAIKQRLGFYPFPGTLNVKMDEDERWKKQQLIQMEPVIIPGFRDKKRTYGDLFAYRCRAGGLECIVVVPMRTHHGPDVIEIIAPVDLKKTLRKKDGGRLKVVL
ncbi:MAG: DUF120 domain-containing protein [Candidatus ainarchaeum sp.]|nr:DUF120 domain-containing protein [Candidatus ainarchaeum sp.]